MRYVHTNIISEDWKKLVSFYIEVFNCKLKPPIRNQSGKWLDRGTGVPNASLEGAHLALPGYDHNGPTLEIYTYRETLPTDPMQPNSSGIGHLAFEVEDVSSILQKLIKHGGSSQGVIISKQVSGVGKITFVYARDPDGNILELQSWEK